MKIIDLLNKIANDEEVPKKIKWNNLIYEKSKYNATPRGCYYRINGGIKLWFLDEINSLTDEVEIIEENKKIEKIEKIGFVADGTSLYFNGKYQDGSIHGVTPKEIAFAIKINELIEEINKLKENKYE